MASHRWGKPLAGPLPQECEVRQKCTKCGMTRLTYPNRVVRVAGRKTMLGNAYEYKMGRKRVDKVGPFMNKTPPCEPPT